MSQETHVGNTIPQGRPMGNRNEVFPLQRVNADMRGIVEGRDKPDFLRVVAAGPEGLAGGAVVRLINVDAIGPVERWGFEVHDGVRHRFLYFNNAERWELRPGDCILLGGNAHVVMQIDKDFFGPNHERAGIRVREDGTGLEEWIGARLDAVTPVLGLAPAAPWVRSEEGSDRKTETVGQVLDLDKTLAEALADDRRMKITQMNANEKRVEEKPVVSDMMTDGDRRAEDARLIRLAHLRKEIPIAEKKLMDMKQELRKLVGAD